MSNEWAVVVWYGQKESEAVIVSAHTHHCRLYWTTRVYGHFRRVKMFSSREPATFIIPRKRRSEHINVAVKMFPLKAVNYGFVSCIRFMRVVTGRRGPLYKPPSPAPQELRSWDHTDHYKPPWNRCGKIKRYGRWCALHERMWHGWKYGYTHSESRYWIHVSGQLHGPAVLTPSGTHYIGSSPRWVPLQVRGLRRRQAKYV